MQQILPEISPTHHLLYNVRYLTSKPRFHCQVAVVPIMSSVLHWRDTTILILAVVGNITGQFLTSFSKSMGVLYFAYVLWMLWNTITTISRYSFSILTLILLLYL